MSVLLLSACGGSDQPNIEPIRGMMESPAYKAQDEAVGGGSSMLVPPENTLAGLRTGKISLQMTIVD